MVDEVLHLGACPKLRSRRRAARMEALRLQLDNLQKEKQELEVKVLKLSQNHPGGGTIIELEKESDQWKEDRERITVENIQLKALYEEIVQHMSDNAKKSQQTVVTLQEQIETAQTNAQCWKCKCKELELELSKVKQQNNELEQKIIQVEASLELKCYRAEAKVQKQWEAREERLVQQLVELQHQVKEKGVDGVLPAPTIKTEPTEVNQPVMLNQQTPEHLSRSTGTQPTRRIQWQNPIKTHSGVSESQHQIPESFVPLDCSPESPVPTRELSGLHSPLYGATQLGNVDPLKFVLLAQNLPPLPKFSGESSDGFCKDTFQDWLEQFELTANVLGWSSQAKLVNLITILQGQAYSFFRSCTMEQRTDYCLLVAELKKRFTPMTLPAIETNLFHDRKQHVSESVDA